MSAEPFTLTVPAEAVDALIEEAARRAAALIEHGIELRERRKWLTVAEAAERLGCSEDAVYKRHARGRLAGRYQGSRLYISAASVDELE